MTFNGAYVNWIFNCDLDLSCSLDGHWQDAQMQALFLLNWWRGPTHCIFIQSVIVSKIVGEMFVDVNGK